MGAAGLQAALDEGRIARLGEGLYNFVMSDCRTTTRRYRHLLPVRGGTADRRLDNATAARGLSPDDRLIEPFEPAVTAMGGKQLGQALMGVICFGDDEQPRGILVKPVDNAGAADSAYPRQAIAAVGDQRVDERSRSMAGGGVDYQSRRLVDNDQMRILIDDIESDCLGLRYGILGGREGGGNFRARFDPVARLNYGLAVHPHMAFGDQTLKARAADIIEAPAQNAIETLTSFGFGDDDYEVVGGCHMRKFSETAIAAGLAPESQSVQDPPNVRVLKYVVVFLGVLLIGCLVTAFGIVGYRLANPKALEDQAKPNELDLAIGANAQLGQVHLDGDRMAVYLKGVLRDELLVIDAKRGRLISRIKLDKSVGPPRSAW
jgi:hypothetical protein